VRCTAATFLLENFSGTTVGVSAFGPHQLRRPVVPPGWLPVLEELAAFEQLGVGSPEAAGRLPRLMKLAEKLHEPAAVADVDEEAVAAAVGRAALHLRQLHRLPHQPLADTMGSRTLQTFGDDFAKDRQRIEALAQTLATPELEAEVAADAVDAGRKLAVAQAIIAAFNLTGPNAQRGGHRLLRAVYPDAPMSVAETHVVVTPMLTFFCLPIKDDKYVGEVALTAASRATADEWCAKVNSVTDSLQAHFPAFSALDTSRIDADLVEKTAVAMNATEQEAREELGRTFTVLPIGQAEKYLVHDVWGHGHQAALLRFDDVYQRMCRYDQPMTIDEKAGDLPLKSCLGDAAKLEAFIDAELAERLPVVMSAVLAELLADVTEHRLAQLMPEVKNSSSLRGEVAKLDLTLRDLTLLYPRLVASFDSANIDPMFREIWQNRRSFAAADGIRWREIEAGVEVSLHALLALHFLSLHRAVRDAADVDGDLLVMAASCFFEQNRCRNLWRLDEAITLHLAPKLRQLGALTDRPTAVTNSLPDSHAAPRSRRNDRA
jgi:hypothetical protein